MIGSTEHLLNVSDHHRVEGAFYSIYGVVVRSDIPLPIDAVTQAAEGTSLTFRYVRGEPPTLSGNMVAELRCYAPCHEGRVAVRLYRDPKGFWLWQDAVGSFRIHSGGRLAEVYPKRDLPQEILGHVLLGWVSVFALQRAGHPVLHAGAIMTERGTVGFLGHKGQGKTTMLANFMAKGHALLTDDALPLQVSPRGVMAMPGVPIVRLWSSTAEMLGCAGSLQTLIPNYEKKYLKLHDGFQNRAAPLRALYLLDRYESRLWQSSQVTFTLLEGSAAVATLVAHTALRALLQPDEAARLLPMYAEVVRRVPIKIFSYPNGFEYQDLVYEEILRDLRGAP